jgi:hypothetical protein
MSTRIWPSNLVQRSAVGNLIPVDTKKVDYAIFYAPPPDRKQRIALQLQPIPEPCNLNQTSRPEHATSVGAREEYRILLEVFEDLDLDCRPCRQAEPRWELNRWLGALDYLLKTQS